METVKLFLEDRGDPEQPECHRKLFALLLDIDQNLIVCDPVQRGLDYEITLKDSPEVWALKDHGNVWGIFKEDKPNAIFDFDGVIHPYNLPFDGHNIPEPPTPETIEAVRKIREEYNIFVFSTRCIDPEGRPAMRSYLKEHGIEVDGIISTKIRAKFYIDDRAFRYTGDWERVHQFLADTENVKPWNKKTKSSITIDDLAEIEHDLMGAQARDLHAMLSVSAKEHPLFSNIYPEALYCVFGIGEPKLSEKMKECERPLSIIETRNKLYSTPYNELPEEHKVIYRNLVETRLKNYRKFLEN